MTFETWWSKQVEREGAWLDDPEYKSIAVSAWEAAQTQWQPIGELGEEYINAMFPTYFIVYTSNENQFMATAYGGEITYLTPIDGLTDDYKTYGEPLYFQPMPPAPMSEPTND